jgi:3alpha(or 20beta)-hydroxysteroid dehydrogenase
MARLDGKVALITGGAGGIGTATARAFTAEGARVMIADVPAQLDSPYEYHQLDVREKSQWDAAVAATRAAFGRLDILVNNAGVWRPAGLLDVTVEDFRVSVDVNQLGTLLGMQAVAEAMKATGGGAIVNVSSGAGMGGFPGQIVYSSTKWAIRGMTKTAAIELGGPGGIRVNSVHPGPVDTPMTAAVSSAHGDAFARWPVPRVAQPEEIASMIVYLASDESAYVTGAEFVIDGGLLAGPALFDPSGD